MPRRPSLPALSALLLLLLAAASADAASPSPWRFRSLFGEGGSDEAAAAPAAPAALALAPSSPPSSTTLLCAEDGPEGCGALVIQPPAAKAALKDYVDCVTVDPTAAGEACVRKTDGSGSGGKTVGNAFSSSSSSSSAAKAESDPRDACPEDPLFDEAGEFSAGDWGAVAAKVRERER